jgi:hypothetical protein
MYAKIENEQVVKAPYYREDLSKDHPNVSFPTALTDEIYAQFGVEKVVVPIQPQYNAEQEDVRKSKFYRSDAGWTFDWEVIKLPESLVATKMRQKRDALLSKTDWRFRSDMTPSQAWIDYCQALRDIPQQEGFPFNVVWPEAPTS